MSARVTAVVLNWNGLDDTLRCISSLEALTYEDLSILVVDNGSELSPRERLEREHSQVRVVENVRNLGYSGGNNIGIARAVDDGAEFVWVLNNDTVVERASLGELVAAAERHPRAAAVGGKVLHVDPADRIWVTWGRVTWLQSLIALVGEGRKDHRRYDVERAVPWIPGCSLLLRSAAVVELGGFDENFFAYHEDVEWAERARRRGWELWYNGRARVHHAVHGSSGGAASYTGFRKYLSARNSVLFARRYGRPWHWALMATAIVLTLPFQFLRRAVRGEGGAVGLKLRGWLDGLPDSDIPFSELGLR
ncbi:MAG: glycosyltransferase family 2 protein [Deltaproteobacteria bacterium]